MRWILGGLIGMLCLGLVVLWSTLFFTRKIQSDYTNFDDLPKVKWEDVLAGETKTLLTIKYKYLEQTNPSVSGNTYLLATGDKMLAQYGSEGPAMVPKKFRNTSGMTIYRFVRPYQLLGYAATSIGDGDMVIMYMGWRNRDESMSLITYVMPRKKYEDINFPDKMGEYLEANILDRVLTPITHIKDKDACMRLSDSNSEYCEWYFANKPTIAEMTKTWMESGVLPDKMYQHPLFMK